MHGLKLTLVMHGLKWPSSKMSETGISAEMEGRPLALLHICDPDRKSNIEYRHHAGCTSCPSTLLTRRQSDPIHPSVAPETHRAATGNRLQCNRSAEESQTLLLRAPREVVGRVVMSKDSIQTMTHVKGLQLMGIGLRSSPYQLPGEDRSSIMHQHRIGK